MRTEEQGADALARLHGGGLRGGEPTPLEKLRKILPEGSTVFYKTVHTARSGMSATLQFWRFYFEPCRLCNGTGEIDVVDCSACHGSRGEVRHQWLAGMIARADLGRWDDKHEGIRVGGCGFDRGHHVIDNIARTLYGRGDALKMERL